MPRDTRNQFLHDIFVIALEGGINYWATVQKYHWSNAKGEQNLLDHCDLEGFYAEITDMEDGLYQDGCQPRYTVNREVIARGIEALATGKATYGGRPLSTKMQAFYAAVDAVNDAGMLDAGTAENVLQAGLWGDIRYG